MAEEPEDRLIRLEEEIEGDRARTADFIFCRIGESVPLKPSDYGFDLQNPPSQPLAVSELSGVLFLAHSEGPIPFLYLLDAHLYFFLLNQGSWFIRVSCCQDSGCHRVSKGDRGEGGGSLCSEFECRGCADW